MKYVSQDFYDYNLATKAFFAERNQQGLKETILKSKNKALIKSTPVVAGSRKKRLPRLYTLSKKNSKRKRLICRNLNVRPIFAEKSLSGKSTEFSAGYSTQKIQFTNKFLDC